MKIVLFRRWKIGRAMIEHVVKIKWRDCFIYDPFE